MNVKYGKEIDHEIKNNIRGNFHKSTKSSVVTTLNFFGYSTK